jgi:hypothetical protein
LPSLEAFEMRAEIPVIYIIFYDYFLKASVGDARWKKMCMMDTHNDDDSLGTVQSESFAMLVLKNNYFAWLVQAKKSNKELITEYCAEPRRRGKLSAAHAWMDNMEVDIDAGPGDTVLVREGDDKYDDLVKVTEQTLKRAATKARQNATYKEVAKKLAEIGDKDIDAIDNEDQMSPEQAKLAKLSKKRNVLKRFREYTVRQGEEGKFKGWSVRAVEDMIKLNSELNDKRVELDKLKRAYKEIYRSRQKVGDNKRTDKETRILCMKQAWGLKTVGVIEI